MYCTGVFFQRGAHYLRDDRYHGGLSDYCDTCYIAVDLYKNQLEKE